MHQGLAQIMLQTEIPSGIGFGNRNFQTRPKCSLRDWLEATS